jgi:hypothetical protein
MVSTMMVLDETCLQFILWWSKKLEVGRPKPEVKRVGSRKAEAGS